MNNVEPLFRLLSTQDLGIPSMTGRVELEHDVDHMLRIDALRLDCYD